MFDNRNWAGNYRYRASELLVPESLEQVQEWTARSSRIRVLGTRHSFNGIADTDGSLLSLAKLNRVVELDEANRRVTVEGGIRYGELGQYLHDRGYALPNLASLPHITAAGAVATATHGSGDRNGGLATSVHALEIVRADGSLARLSRDDGEGDIAGAIVGLGGLGAVTKLTMNVVPSFEVGQRVYERLPLAQLERDFDAIFSGGYSVSLFTDWKQAAFNQVWVKKTASPADSAPDAGDSAYFGAVPAGEARHPVPGQSAENCSGQLGVPGPWHERLPHFRMAFTPSAGEELQSEYFVARADAYEALCEVAELRERIAPLLFVSEIRTIAADDLWMSPCFGQESAGIHFTWRPDWAAVKDVLPLIEERLARFGARPHWGKLFTMAPERLQPLYAKLPDFRELLLRFDPQGKFRNDFLNRYIMAGAE